MTTSPPSESSAAAGQTGLDTQRVHAGGGGPTPAPVDWHDLARRLWEERTRLAHDKTTNLHGLDFDAEILRRAFAAAGQPIPDAHALRAGGSNPTTVDEVILALQRQQLVLVRDKRGQAGQRETRYADLQQVTQVVLAALNELDTTWTCLPQMIDGSFGLHYSLRHVPSGTEKTGIWPLKLSDNPQALGSAVTYGRRYALLAVTGVPAEDEDDDGAAGQPGVARRRTATQPSASQPPAGPGKARAQRARAAAGPPLPSEEPAGWTAEQRSAVMALFAACGVADRVDRLAITSAIVGRKLASANELSREEASALIDTLDGAQRSPDPAAYLADWRPS